MTAPTDPQATVTFGVISDYGSGNEHEYAVGRGLAAIDPSFVATAYDNALCESFFATLQRELLDTRSWTSREQLGQAIFEYIEAWYNPHRRHSRLGYESPVSYEQTGRAAAVPA